MEKLIILYSFISLSFSLSISLFSAKLRIYNLYYNIKLEISVFHYHYKISPNSLTSKIFLDYFYFFLIFIFFQYHIL